jgi:hypothetical protein
MKKLIKITAIMLLLAGMMVSCGKEENIFKYEIYENHDISACGVEDPLRNIEWLKAITDEILLAKEDIRRSFKIDLYQENETKNHVILIPYSPDKKIFEYKVYDCSGELTKYYAGPSGEPQEKSSKVPPQFPLDFHCTFISTLWSLTIE